MTDHTHNEPRDPHGRFAHDQHDVASSTVARVLEKADTARDVATDAARRTAQTIEANPLGILMGGLAVGVLAGALIPRTAQEKDLLAPLGKTLSARARAAIHAARETARTELDQNGLTKNAAQAQVRSLVESLTKVAQNVGTAAVKSAAEKG